MTHDEMMSLLANTLADAAGSSGCLPILDCFSPHPGEEVTVSIPMCDDTVDIVLEDLDFPHEWEELLENSCNLVRRTEKGRLRRRGWGLRWEKAQKGGKGTNLRGFFED